MKTLVRQPIAFPEKRKLTDIRTTQTIGMYSESVCAACESWGGLRMFGSDTDANPKRLPPKPIAPRAMLTSLNGLCETRVPNRMIEAAISRPLSSCKDT